MESELNNTLKQLCSISVVSGYETTDKSGLREILQKENVNFEEDTIGNIIIKKDGLGERTLMIVAHYDEIGFSVKYIDDSGYVFVSQVGGVDLSIIQGRRVVINHNGKSVYGVIGAQPIHFKNANKGNNNNKPIDICELWVDLGVRNGTEKERELVSVGDPISFEPNFTNLDGNLICSKSLDNRGGVAALLSLYRKIRQEEIINYKSIYFVASAQEEVGLRGASVASFNIHPDISIAIDATHATDYPTINNRKYGDIKLGEGAVIPLGSNFSNSLQENLRNVARTNDIKYQLDSLPSHSGTDIATIQLMRGGCLSGLVSIPCRYMHTPTEVISLDDVSSVIEILYQFIKL